MLILNKVKDIVSHNKTSKNKPKRKAKPIGSYHVTIPNNVNVRAIREKLKLTQQQFADVFGFSINSVRNWEQERRNPEGPARLLLVLIQANPKAVLETLRKENLC